MRNTFPLILTVPANTPKRAPVSVTVNSGLSACLAGDLTIPTGAAGLVGIRLTSRGRPIYPVTGDFITGDGKVFSWANPTRLDGPPWQLTLEAYNLDDTYPHTIRALVDCGDLATIGIR